MWNVSTCRLWSTVDGKLTHCYFVNCWDSLSDGIDMMSYYHPHGNHIRTRHQCSLTTGYNSVEEEKNPSNHWSLYPDARRSALISSN